jgi:hypothetical protein
VQTHFYFKPFTEQFRGGHQEVFFFLDHIAHIIGQTAVGKGDIFAPVEYDNFRCLGNPAGPRCAGSAAGDTAHNQNSFSFHLPVPYRIESYRISNSTDLSNLPSSEVTSTRHGPM